MAFNSNKYETILVPFYVYTFQVVCESFVIGIICNTEEPIMISAQIWHIIIVVEFKEDFIHRRLVKKTDLNR